MNFVFLFGAKPPPDFRGRDTQRYFSFFVGRPSSGGPPPKKEKPTLPPPDADLGAAYSPSRSPPRRACSGFSGSGTLRPATFQVRFPARGGKVRFSRKSDFNWIM